MNQNSEDDIVYKQAIDDIKNLVNDVIVQCEGFSAEYYYEKDWVFDMFREQLNKTIRSSNKR